MTNDLQFGSTLVNKKVCGLYTRDETHQLGEWNHTPNNWWVLVDDEFLPWVDKLTHRPCWDIQIKQGNYTKVKWDEMNIHGTISCIILCNNREVYSFGCRDLYYAFVKAQLLIAEFTESSFDFVNPESMIGRKVWYYDNPAIIERLILNQGCIMLESILETGFILNHPWYDDEMPNEWHGEKKVKVEIDSPNIHWHRK